MDQYVNLLNKNSSRVSVHTDMISQCHYTVQQEGGTGRDTRTNQMELIYMCGVYEAYDVHTFKPLLLPVIIHNITIQLSL